VFVVGSWSKVWICSVMSQPGAVPAMVNEKELNVVTVAHA